MSEVLNKIDKDYGSKINTKHVYVDEPENRAIAMEYEVRYVPMLIFKDSNGKEISRKVGYMPLKEVLAVFRNAGINI